MIYRRFFFLFFLFLLNFLPAKSSDTTNDFGLWNIVKLNVPITEKVEGQFIVSPRLLDDWTDFNQLILHTVLGYKLNKNFSLWQGYAWSTTYPEGFDWEHRLYNDLIYRGGFRKLGLENRLRFEERFIEDADSVSLRGRWKLKFLYPITKRGDLKLVFFDEFFLNFNAVDDGPDSGFDQNRIFIGLNKKVSEHFSLEGGYQLQHLNRRGGEGDRLNHFVLLQVEGTLPQIIKNK